MTTTLAKLDSSRLTLNESAWLRCQAAVEFKDRGDYDGAREVMRPFWIKFGERPELEGLNPAVEAAVKQVRNGVRLPGVTGLALAGSLERSVALCESFLS